MILSIDAILSAHGIGGSGSIKSIQRINATISAASQTFTISSVKTNNTIVYLEYPNVVSNIGNSPNVELTNSTTITVNVYSAPSPSYTLTVVVVEYYNVRSKQTGQTTASGTALANPYNVTISSVNTAKCLCLATFTCSSGAASRTGVGSSASLTNATTLSINSYDGTGISGTVKWQVLEFL